MFVSDIKPYDKNAKKHTKKQVEQVANSIKEFGFNQPVVVDKNGVLIVGHGRLEAAKLLGLKEIPAITLDISEEKANAYRLADNKLNESEWDMKLVIDELKTLTVDLVDITGFDKDLLIEADEADDVIPENVPSRSKLGDVYQLGPHTMVCGDSTDEEAWKKVMQGRKADCVFTDPPYNVNYSGRGKNTSEGILNDDMSEGAFDTFLEAAFGRVSEAAKSGAGWYVFHSTSTQAQFEKALKKFGMAIRNQLIWNKPTASMGWGDYRWKHEPFFYASKEGTETVFYGDRTHHTILDFHDSEQKLLNWAKRQKKLETEGKLTIWTMKRDKVNEYKHPTQKPVELITYALFNSSKAEDVIIDPFLGSGSTLIACEKTGRICFGMELDPKYVDVIVQRYVDYTGNQNIKLNGEEIIWKKTE